MLTMNFILLVICAQIFHIHCYTVNHMQRNFWSDYDIEPKDEFLAKLLHTENLFHNEIPSMNALESTDGRSHDLQKRGRQCLWKVCSWALDKRSISSKMFY